MKKILIVLLLIITPFLIWAEYDIPLNTPYERDISITIPDNDLDRIRLIVEISELYWGERYDHEQTTNDLDKALVENDNLIIELKDVKDQLVIANDTIDELRTALKQKDTDYFSWGINLLGGGVLKNDIISMSIKVNPYIQVFELLNLGLYVEYPIGIGISIGVEF